MLRGMHAMSLCYVSCIKSSVQHRMLISRGFYWLLGVELMNLAGGQGHWAMPEWVIGKVPSGTAGSVLGWLPC